MGLGVTAPSAFCEQLRWVPDAHRAHSWRTRCAAAEQWMGLSVNMPSNFCEQLRWVPVAHPAHSSGHSDRCTPRFDAAADAAVHWPGPSAWRRRCWPLHFCVCIYIDRGATG